MDFLLRAELHSSGERRAARLPAVSVAHRAAMASHAGVHRCGPARRVLDRRVHRGGAGTESGRRARGAADRCLGIRAWSVPDLLRIQGDPELLPRVISAPADVAYLEVDAVLSALSTRRAGLTDAEVASRRA